MSGFENKKSILNKLKSIVAKTKRRFSWHGKVKDENVSAFAAADIQDEAYRHIKNLRHNTYTPPYLELAAQLLADEEQIFKAAANHLTLIAKSRKRYAPQIREVFNEVISGRKLSAEKLEYISHKLEEI